MTTEKTAVAQNATTADKKPPVKVVYHTNEIQFQQPQQTESGLRWSTEISTGGSPREGFQRTLEVSKGEKGESRIISFGKMQSLLDDPQVKKARKITIKNGKASIVVELQSSPTMGRVMCCVTERDPSQKHLPEKI